MALVQMVSRFAKSVVLLDVVEAGSDALGGRACS